MLVDSQLNMSCSVSRWSRGPMAPRLIPEKLWPAELGSDYPSSPGEAAP